MLAYLQKLAAADKTALVAALVSSLGLLAATFGLKLDATQTALAGVVATFIVNAFVHAHVNSKPPAPPEAPKQ